MFQFESSQGTIIKVYWIVALLFVASVYLIVSLAKRAMLKSTIRSFNNGIADAVLLKKCERQKKFYRFGNTVIIHDLLCCMIAAIALVQNDQKKFIQNIHQIKAVSGDTEHRLKILFLAYLTGQKYVDLSVAYQKRSPNEKGRNELILAMYDELGLSKTFADEKIQSLSNLIESQDLREILFLFHKTEDGSVS